MPSTVEQVKDRLTIVDVVGSYLKLEKAGVNYKARCPFHNEKSPSFFVSPSRQTYHCFGCNRGGDIFSFIQEIEGIDFMEALRELANRAGVEMADPGTDKTLEREKEAERRVLEEAVEFYKKNLKSSKKAIDYLKNRGLAKKIIEDFSLGLAEDKWRDLYDYLTENKIKLEPMISSGMIVKNEDKIYDRFRDRIIFPFYDYGGRLIGFAGRTLNDSNVKYINSPQTKLYDKSRFIYGLYEAKKAIRQNDRAILVEGYLDVLMSHQAGVSETIGLSGTALTKEHLKILMRLTDNLIVVMDADRAGIEASSKNVMLALEAGMNVKAVSLPTGKDPAELIKDSPETWRGLVEKSISFIDYMLLVLTPEKFEQKEMFQKVRKDLYPYLRALKGELEKDENLRKIAGHLNVSADSARIDYGNWEMENPSDDFLPEQVEAEKESRSRKDSLAYHLAGLILWQESLPKSSLETKKARERITNLGSYDKYLKSGLNRAESAIRQKMIYESEALFKNSKSLEKEFSDLLSDLEQENLRENLQNTLFLLRKAEKDGDDEAASKYLKQCQKLSGELNKIQVKVEKKT